MGAANADGLLGEPVPGLEGDDRGKPGLLILGEPDGPPLSPGADGVAGAPVPPELTGTG